MADTVLTTLDEVKNVFVDRNAKIVEVSSNWAEDFVSF